MTLITLPLPDFTEDMKTLGERALSKLDRSWDKPTSALWLDFYQKGWVLTFATFSARVDNLEDRKPVEKRVDEIISFLSPGSNFTFSLMAPSNKTLGVLAGKISTEGYEITWVGVEGPELDAIGLRKAFVYRLSLQNYRNLEFLKTF